MKGKFARLVILAFVLIQFVGCSDRLDSQLENRSDKYNDVRNIAWEFVKENGWNEQAKGDWKDAKVIKIVADDQYELLDDSYEGEEVLSVISEEDGNYVTGTPTILIDSTKNEVIGYIATE
ncbi:hypothetical protein CEY16_13545 [Halalkalibacillus sediminis]|uniref:Uncharacterized protein n=1 Tax=Halalkalibacillus sediminis TaxID=2018042 RepID=A0A2I0QR79_9BACI|nr:hypothetical protein [Halalkalibacillus sediminis]PKR76833.1 hypothetical protein CEY16_13545 [Halalkalibacillus sediminis]